MIHKKKTELWWDGPAIYLELEDQLWSNEICHPGSVHNNAIIAVYDHPILPFPNYSATLAASAKPKPFFPKSDQISVSLIMQNTSCIKKVHWKYQMLGKCMQCKTELKLSEHAAKEYLTECAKKNSDLAFYDAKCIPVSSRIHNKMWPRKQIPSLILVWLVIVAKKGSILSMAKASTKVVGMADGHLIAAIVRAKLLITQWSNRWQYVARSTQFITVS